MLLLQLDPNTLKNMKMKALIIFLCIISLASTSFSQSKINCFQISELINFEQILKNFRISDRSDSLILIDKNKILSIDCSVLNWGRNRLHVTHDSLLIKMSVKEGSAAMFNGQCQYFVIDNFKKSGSYYTYTIFHACSNEFIDCKILRKKNKYKMIWFSGGVY